MLTPKDHFINRKHIIEKAYGTQQAFCKVLKITYMGLYKALTCQTRNHLMHDHIVRHLPGETKESFWPELYGDQPESADNIEHHEVGVLSSRC
jgi:hypothetical protein